jgi:ketosteroid isomerase-like protein
MQRHIIFFLAAITLSIFACHTMSNMPQGTDDKMEVDLAAARKTIESKNEMLKHYWANGQADSIACLYTENACIMPNGSPVIFGRVKIQEHYINQIKRFPKINVETESVIAYGPLAVERGNWTVYLNPNQSTDKNNETMTLSGKFLTQWRRIDNEWLMETDIANNN